jgi:spore germination protein YaaH
MRDKYIELIISYIKERPGYEEALEEIKKEVLALGATEAEFEQALTNIAGSVPTINSSTQTIVTKEEPNRPKLISSALQFKKQLAVSVAVILIATFFLTQNIKFNKTTDNTQFTQTQPKINQTSKNLLIPIVYASSLPVDADKIFSIKSNNVTLTVTGKPKKEVLGFFPYWMIDKADNITLNTLTQVSIFGLETDANGNIITGGNDEINKSWTAWQDPQLDKFISRARSYGLKVNLTIKAFNSSNIDSVVTSDTSQKALIANILYLVNSKNLDGVNIDFEYVGNPADTTRTGFTRFITNLNSELKRQNPKSTLTIDTYLVSGSDKGIFDIPALALNSDAFVIMGYDMHTPKDSAGSISAMGGETNIVGYVQNYLEKVDPSKIILAVPYYGYDWPKNNTGNPGDVKILPYAQIASQSNNKQLTWDETSQTPSFSYSDSDGVQRIVYFDNVRSLGIKYDFINKKNLKGVGIWALGYDGNNQDLQKLLIDKFINQ